MLSLFIVNKHGSLLFQNDFVPRTGTTTNDKIRLASTFHTLSAMAAEVSPVRPLGAIRGLTHVAFEAFCVHCLNTVTGLQIMLVTNANVSSAISSDVLSKIYLVYAEHAMGNPFYVEDMPIRLAGFNRGVKAVIAGTGQTVIL